MATAQELGTSHVDTQEKVIAGSSILELIAGAAAVVLPILGLVGVFPSYLASIAFIAVGAGMMSQGGGLTAQSRSLVSGARSGSPEAMGMIGGMSAEILGGAAVVALGILALLRIAPVPLLASAAIVTGGALVIGSGNTAALSTFRYGAATRLDNAQRDVLRESVRAAAGADILAGLGSIVLGILVLANVGSASTHMTLALVAALAAGGALFLNGTTIGARMTALLA